MRVSPASPPKTLRIAVAISCASAAMLFMTSTIWSMETGAPGRMDPPSVTTEPPGVPEVSSKNFSPSIPSLETEAVESVRSVTPLSILMVTTAWPMSLSTMSSTRPT